MRVQVPSYTCLNNIRHQLNMETSYLYKITFEETPHFYIGVRKHPDPKNDNDYLGTPYTHKNYWEIYTPKKQILWIYEDWEFACKIEKSIISENWQNKYCLNMNIGGIVPTDFCRLGAIRANKTIELKRELDSDYDSKFLEHMKKMNESKILKMKEDDEYSKLCIRGLWKGIPKSHRVEIGKKIQKSLGVEITCFDENTEKTLTFPSIRTAAKHYGFGINTISKLVSGKLLSYKGISVITPL
jgi:hypothetical protein